MIAAGDKVVVGEERGTVLSGGGWVVPVRFDGEGDPALRTRFVDKREIVPDLEHAAEQSKPEANLQGEIDRLKTIARNHEEARMRLELEFDSLQAELRNARRTMQRQTSTLDAICSMLKQRLAEG